MGRVVLFIRLGLLIHSSSSRGCLNVSWIRLLVNRFVIKTGGVSPVRVYT